MNTVLISVKKFNPSSAISRSPTPVDFVPPNGSCASPPTVGGEAQLPFGGTKSTGVGEREMAEEGLNFFTEIKTVFINYSGNAERSMTR